MATHMHLDPFKILDFARTHPHLVCSGRKPANAVSLSSCLGTFPPLECAANSASIYVMCRRSLPSPASPLHRKTSVGWNGPQLHQLQADLGYRHTLCAVTQCTKHKHMQSHTSAHSTHTRSLACVKILLYTHMLARNCKRTYTCCV